MTTKYQYNLAQLRKDHSLTQAEAARAFGVSVKTWCRHETAGAVPLLWYHAIIGFKSIKAPQHG